jgi:hypothetical protein
MAKNQAMSLLEKMRESAKPKLKSVTIEGWGTVHIAVLTVGEMDAINSDGTASSMAKTFARFICNPDGSRAFNLDDPEQMKVLESQPFNKVSVLLKAINEINAISIEGVDEAKKG